MINYSIATRAAKPGTKKKDVKETKAYATAQVTEVVTLNDFAKHISSHGSVYGRHDVLAVLTLMVDCMREMLLEGKKIQLGELGSFTPSIRCKGAVNASQFTDDNIADVTVTWNRGKNFRSLRKDATFHLVPSRDAQAAAILEAKSQEGIQLPGEIE